MISMACWCFFIYDLEVWFFQLQTTTQRLLITCTSSVSPVFLQQMPLAHTKKHSQTLIVTASSIWKFLVELVRRWVNQRWWWPWAQGSSNWWWLVCRRTPSFFSEWRGKFCCEFDKQNVGAIEVLLLFFLAMSCVHKEFLFFTHL